MNVTASTSWPAQSLLESARGMLQRARNYAGVSASSRNFARRVSKALAVQPRGAVRNDAVLQLADISLRLHVEWFAREIHPWDQDLPEGRRAELFALQSLEDVDAAIPRLFEQLPEIDVLEVAVLERASKTRIMAGTIHRHDLLSRYGSSAGMRLKTIGINYRLNYLRFEPIP
jgi:hypothetical protein